MPVDSPPTVETVVVRTTRLPPSFADPAFSIVRIDPPRLTQSPRLDEAIARSPGAGLFRRTSSLGANPTTQGVSLREIAPSGAGRALVVLDGAPQNDPFGGWVIWSALPPEGLSSVELARGAGAGPYGAGALTGAVTLNSVEGSMLSADASAGDLGQARIGLAAAGGEGRFDTLVTAAAQRSDGWVPVREGRGAVDARLTLDSRTAAVRLRADVGAAVVAARIGAYSERRESGLQGADSRVQGHSASLTVAQAGGTERDWRVQGWYMASDLRNRSVAVAQGRGSTAPANDQYETPAAGYGVNAALRGAGGRWEVGGDLRAYDGETRELFRHLNGAFTRSRVAGGKAMVGGVYGEARRRSGPWLVTGGVRLDRWSASDGERTERDLASGAATLDAPSADRRGWAPTARAGVRRDWSGVFARGAAYAGFRPPTLNELHRPFRVGNDVTEANPALHPETLYGVEGGLGGDTARGRWSVTLFYNRLDDPVTNVTVGVGPGTFLLAGFIPAGGVLRRRQNAGHIDAVGVEAEATQALADALRLGGALAYAAAEVDGGPAAPQLTGLRPAQAPRFSASLSLEARPVRRASLLLEMRHEGMRFEDDLNSRRLGAFTTFDARAAFAVTPAVEAYVAVDNLLDADVATGRTADGVTSYGPPRAVRAGLNLRL